jgi:fatty acid desaturase
LHNIHHLYPQLPFTRYGKIWAKHKDALIAAGTETHPVYHAKKDWAWNETFDGKKK